MAMTCRGYRTHGGVSEFCHFAARPGDLVAPDTFYDGKLKGVYQRTAIDAATCGAPAQLVVGERRRRSPPLRRPRRWGVLAVIGVEFTGVLSDSGPELTGRDFTTHMSALGSPIIGSRRARRASTSVCERFEGTRAAAVLPARVPPPTLRHHSRAGAHLQSWLRRYNNRRQPRRFMGSIPFVASPSSATNTTAHEVDLSPQPVRRKR